MPHAGQKWDIILKPAKMHYITSFNFNNTTKPAIVNFRHFMTLRNNSLLEIWILAVCKTYENEKKIF